MNNMEEKLWDYIDGNCTAEEQNAIKSLIAKDEALRLKYEKLLLLNNEFSAMELDEPPMAFTYNVIEAIRAEQAQQPLKATINKRIIKGIGLFFILTITLLLLYTIANISWSSINVSTVTLKLPEVKNYLTRPVILSFLFFDVVLALFLLDSYLRKKSVSGHI